MLTLIKKLPVSQTDFAGNFLILILAQSNDKILKEN